MLLECCQFHFNMGAVCFQVAATSSMGGTCGKGAGVCQISGGRALLSPHTGESIAGGGRGDIPTGPWKVCMIPGMGFLLRNQECLLF